MKKALMITLTAMMMVGCAEQQNFETQVWETPAKVPEIENIDDLMAQAKWGDGAAYLKLAECYKDGLNGVKPDFMTTMTMLSMAKEYGAIGRPDEYLSKLPEDDNIRMAYESMENLDGTDKKKGMELAERLINKGCAEGYALKGYALFIQGDSLEAMRMTDLASERGSSLGTLLKYVIPFYKMKEMPDESILSPISETIPFLNLFIAEEYIRDLAEHPENDVKAAKAYLRADGKGCLDSQGADWLLAYMESGNELPLSENDILRLRKLAEYGREKATSTDFNEIEIELCEEAADSVSLEDMVETAEETIGAVE